MLCATYNGAAYLRQQVASIDQQTLRPRRLFIRDDGSSDGTLLLLASLKQQYGDWLELLPADGNLGCIANVNRLLNTVSAPYVALAARTTFGRRRKWKHRWLC